MNTYILFIGLGCVLIAISLTPASDALNTYERQQDQKAKDESLYMSDADADDNNNDLDKRQEKSLANKVKDVIANAAYGPFLQPKRYRYLPAPVVIVKPKKNRWGRVKGWFRRVFG